MHRSFADNQNFNLETVQIADPGEIHHIRDVLRLKCGDQIIIFNGTGEEAEAEILENSRECITLKVCRRFELPVYTAHEIQIVLACAIPKKSKFEWIIEKATELGVSEIQPLKTARTEFKMDPARLTRKEERYKTMAINAAKQCRRRTIPKVHPVTDLESCLQRESQQSAQILFPCLCGDRRPLHDLLSEPVAPRIMILIGPEGDWTPDEVRMALEYQAVPVSLGPTILKVETAAIACLAALVLSHHRT